MRIKKWIALITISLLVFASFPLSASAAGKYSSKDEVIYVNLDAKGKTKNIYVVNAFHMTKPGKIADYGDYVDVRNLTDLSSIEKTNQEEVHFEAEEDEFYYQGELQNASLPWDISINYLLDGKEIHPDELAGQNGNLDIQISTSANAGVNPLFFEHFLLQISLTLDPAIFHNIQAPKGTEANEGKNKQITFTVLPEQEEVLIVSAKVTELEMDPIDIAAIPANIAIEDPDISGMTGDMTSLSDAISAVHKGVASLSGGVAELSEGASELSKGSAEYRKGMNELDQSSGELVEGSKEIRGVLRQVSKAFSGGSEINMPDLGELEALPKGFRELATELRNIASFMEQLDRAISDIPGQINESEINELYENLIKNNIDTSVLEHLINTYEAAQIVKGISEQSPVKLAAILSEMASQLDELANGMEASMDDLDQLDNLADLQDGLTTLASEYGTFHNGLVSYESGVHTLAASYEELDTGISELASGIFSLKEGSNELQEGTKELQKETGDLPDEMQSKIDEFMEEYDFSNFEPASFVSDRNENIEVVQFVLQTERIEIKELETNEEEEEETKSLWDRFMDLFR